MQPLVNTVDYPDIRPEPPVPPTPSHEAVDLGLSVLWATCNIGASSPEEYGDYYAWGELITKDDYSEETYTYTDNPEILPADHDTATQLWGDGWRMPTANEIEELIATKEDTNNYEWTWKEIDGRTGWEIKYLDNDNSMFLPAAGYYEGTTYDGSELYGTYWSSNKTDDPIDSWTLDFSSTEVSKEGYFSYLGNSIRPVKQK